MSQRRQAREFALKMLFQIDLGKLDPQAVVAYFLENQDAAEEVKAYAKTITKGVLEEQAFFDALISKKAHHWKLERIATIERNILRMAAYELLRCPEVPKSVVINEAIEIAKKYSQDDAGAFVNGILDQLQQEMGHPAG